MKGEIKMKWEQGTEKNMWTKEGWSDRRLKKTPERRASWFELIAKCNKNYQVGEDEVGGACSANERDEDSVKFIDRKARGKRTARKTKKWMGREN
jgi:hypothetical protein